MPLIAAYQGDDTVIASRKFAEQSDPAIRLITLVDFDNDCVGTSLAVARVLGDRLYGVRLDTSETLVDKSVIPQMGTFKPTGVNPSWSGTCVARSTPKAYRDVKIIVFRRLHGEKIRDFEEQNVPVDAYGVGFEPLSGQGSTSPPTLVMLEGKPCAKVGRAYRPSSRLERVS